MAGLLVTPKYSYFRNLLPLVSVVGLFSPFIFLHSNNIYMNFDEKNMVASIVLLYLAENLFFLCVQDSLINPLVDIKHHSDIHL